MAVPKEIREVPRPKNTFVLATGKNKDHYSVIERLGCKRKGKRCVPINGRTVGHIIDGEYVPLNEEEKEKNSKKKTQPEKKVESDIKEWASVDLCKQQLMDQKLPLCETFGYKDGIALFVIGILKVCFPGVTDYELEGYYRSSSLATDFPGVALSPDSISALWKRLGSQKNKVLDYMRQRIDSVSPEDTILIDSTLRCNDSIVNDLSDHSRKSRLKNRDHIVDMFSFSLNTKEILALLSYPGNMTDTVIYKDFMENVQHDKGTGISDKGIPATMIIGYLEEHPNYHFIYPLKRNLSIIKKYGMMDMERPLYGAPGIMVKKVALQEEDNFIQGRKLYLYSFLNFYTRAKELADWAKHHNNPEVEFPKDKYDAKMETCGTVTFLSDHDWTPEEIYEAYQQRWEIEIFIRYYHQALEIDKVRVHETKSIYGSDMSNYLAVLLTCRLLKLFDSKGYLRKKTFKQLMQILHRGSKIKNHKGEWKLNTMNPSELEFLKDMGLDVQLPEKKPVGHPRTNEEKNLLEQKRAQAKSSSEEKKEDEKDKIEPFISRANPLERLFEILDAGMWATDEDCDDPIKDEINIINLGVKDLLTVDSLPKEDVEKTDQATSKEPKKRGRKQKNQGEVAVTPASPEPKKRGRKPKSQGEVAVTPASPEPKKRGRKPKNQGEVAVTPASPEPKKRGRKPKNQGEVAVTPASPEPKKRGRKPKNGN